MSLGRELIYSTIEAEAAQTNGVERENNNGQPLTDYHSMCAIVYIRFIYFFIQSVQHSLPHSKSICIVKRTVVIRNGIFCMCPPVKMGN